MINYIEFINKVSGIVKEAAAAPAPVQEKEPGAALNNFVNKIPNPPLIRPIDFSGAKEPTTFKALPDRAILPGSILRNVIGWLQYNAKAGIDKAWDNYTRSGGAPRPPEYDTYKYWREGHINSIPRSHYEGRIGEQEIKDNANGMHNSMPKSFYLGR